MTVGWNGVTVSGNADRADGGDRGDEATAAAPPDGMRTQMLGHDLGGDSEATRAVPARPDLGLPEHWPSAWPSLRGQVALGAVLPVLAAVLTLAGEIWLGIADIAWWLPLLPLILLIGPLTRPARIRRLVDTADRRGRLQVTVATLGLLAVVPGRRGRARVTVEVLPAGRVVYRTRRR